MSTQMNTTVVRVFQSADEARSAVNELRSRNFAPEQIGVITRRHAETTGSTMDSNNDSYAAEGAATGVATGAGLGALWGLGMVAGVMPVLGPAIAGGTLAAVLTSAAAGATAAGIAGSLIGLGIPKEEATYYEGEVHSGRTIVTVSARGRDAEAIEILSRHGGYARQLSAV